MAAAARLLDMRGPRSGHGQAQRQVRHPHVVRVVEGVHAEVRAHREQLGEKRRPQPQVHGAQRA